MKAKPPQSALVIFAWQRIGFVDKITPVMKGGVETRDLPCGWKGFHSRLNSCKIVRLMQRRERRERPQFDDDLGRDDDRRREIEPAMHDAMADARHTGLGKGSVEPVHDGTDRGLVISRIRFYVDCLAALHMKVKARRGPQPVNCPRGDLSQRFPYREKREFDR